MAQTCLMMQRNQQVLALLLVAFLGIQWLRVQDVVTQSYIISQATANLGNVTHSGELAQGHLQVSQVSLWHLFQEAAVTESPVEPASLRIKVEGYA